MGWEMSLCVTVYDRRHWLKGLEPGSLARCEKVFIRDVPLVYDEHDLAMALRLCAADATKWLTKVKPDLVSEVVVSLYSLEIK